MIASLEEIAYRACLISDDNLTEAAERRKKNAYGQYLAKLLNEKN